MAGERNAAVQIVRARDSQLVKITKYVNVNTPVLVGDFHARNALLDNVKADRDALAGIVASLPKTATVAQVKALKASAQAYKAANYEDAADLLYWAYDNIESANEEPTAVGASEAVAKALEAAALLVQVRAVNAVDLLRNAETLLDESDEYLYGADEDDEDDEDMDDEEDETDMDFRRA